MSVYIRDFRGGRGACDGIKHRTMLFQRQPTAFFFFFLHKSIFRFVHDYYARARTVYPTTVHLLERSTRIVDGTS